MQSKEDTMLERWGLITWKDWACLAGLLVMFWVALSYLLWIYRVLAEAISLLFKKKDK